MSIIKRISAVLLLLAVLLVSTACGNSTTANEYIDLSGATSTMPQEELTSDITVFYQDENGYIVPVHTTVPWSEGIAKSVIRKMMYTQELQQELVIMGLESLMPPEASMKGLDISNGLAKIDFNSAKLTLKTAKDERNFVQGVVLALTCFPTVKSVQFMFNGHVVDALPNGTPVGMPIKAEDINAQASAAAGTPVKLYYHGQSASNFDYFVPVTAYLKNTDCISAINYMIQNQPENLSCSIPTDARLLDVQIIDSTLCLFFNDEFNNLQNSYKNEVNAIKSISLTCNEFFDCARIKIYAGNKEYVPQDGIDTPAFANIY